MSDRIKGFVVTLADRNEEHGVDLLVDLQRLLSAIRLIHNIGRVEFVVTLQKPMRDDDSRVVQDAIAMLAGVKDVRPSVMSFEDHINRAAAVESMREMLWKALKQFDQERDGHRNA